MTKYLLSIVQPDGAPPDDVSMSQIASELGRLNDDLEAADAWVFTGGLQPPKTSRVVRANGAVTDGPYVESKEHIGGIYVIDAPDDDAALEWARRAATATTLPIEIRPFQGGDPF